VRHSLLPDGELRVGLPSVIEFDWWDASRGIFKVTSVLVYLGDYGSPLLSCLRVSLLTPTASPCFNFGLRMAKLVSLFFLGKGSCVPSFRPWWVLAFLEGW